MTSLIEIIENETNLIIITAIALSSIFIILGILVDRYKYYNLIAGYNLEPRHIKEQYDIEGLANHIGNGLITLGVLLIIGAAFLYLSFLKLLTATIFIFLFIVLIIIIGSKKFMPHAQNLAKKSPSDARHHFMHWLMPERIFRALEEGTRKWLQECRHCGYKQDYWEAGNIRYKAVGEPIQLQYCENCKKLRLHKVRKKTAIETEEFINQTIRIDNK